MSLTQNPQPKQLWPLKELRPRSRLLWLTPAPQTVHATLTQLQSQGTKANHRLADAPAVLDLLKLDYRLSLSQLAIPLAWLEAKDMICFLLHCASMFLLIFNTVNQSKARFDIYRKAVSLQSENENKKLDYTNLSTPPSHWSSPHPFLCQYLPFCSYFLLLNLAMGNAKTTHLFNFSCRIWIKTI